ncbi:hypothetical protein EON65_45660, partial [archaeon]
MSSPLSVKDRIAQLKAKESAVKPAGDKKPEDEKRDLASEDKPAEGGVSRRPSIADRIAAMKAASAASSPPPKSTVAPGKILTVSSPSIPSLVADSTSKKSSAEPEATKSPAVEQPKAAESSSTAESMSPSADSLPSPAVVEDKTDLPVDSIKTAEAPAAIQAKEPEVEVEVASAPECFTTSAPHAVAESSTP